MSFEIVGPNGERYELASAEAFLDEYEPKGFVIAPDQPHWSAVPDIKALQSARREKTKATEVKPSKKVKGDSPTEASAS